MRTSFGRIIIRCRSGSIIGGVFASLLLVCCNLVDAQARHLVTLEDLLSLRSADLQMDLSPTGEMLAYVVKDASEENLWLVSVKEGTLRRVGQGIMPLWSPDGARLAFYSSRSGKLQLWAFDVETNQATQITNLSGGISPTPFPLQRSMSWVRDTLRYCWSPDGTQIAFTSQFEVKRAEGRQVPEPNSEAAHNPNGDSHKSQDDGPLVLKNTSPAFLGLSGVFQTDLQDTHYVNGNITRSGDRESSRKYSSVITNQLFTVDVRSKRAEQLTKDEDHNFFNPDWSPDGRDIAYVSTEGRSLVADSDPSSSNIYVIDVHTRHKSAVLVGPGEKRRPSWSPDGKWIAYLGRRVHFGRQGVFVISHDGGDPLDITAHLDRDVSFWFYWSPDSRSVLLSCRDGVSQPIVRAQIANGQIEKLTTADAYYGPFAVSRAGKLAWVQSDGSGDGVFYVAGSDAQNARALLELNPQIKQWSVGQQEVVRWKNNRGEMIEGILIKPIDYQKGKTYPLIVDLYSYQQNRFMANPLGANQTLASKNYAVFLPNHRAPHMWPYLMKNEAYSQVARGAPGLDIMVDDVMTGTDWLIKWGIADPQRMCLYGLSNGALSVDLLVTRTSRFKCAVSAAGSYSDWPLFFFLNPRGAAVAELFGGVTPWDDPETYLTLSPVYHLDEVTTPMLLAVGDQDLNAILPSLEMYDGLRYLHRDVTLLRYPRQGHGFTGAALKDYWQRVNAFFDLHLKPDRTSPN